MIENNIPFKNFILQLQHSTANGKFSNKDFEITNDMLKYLLNPNNKEYHECKIKSFFTFNQQNDRFRYRPINQDFEKNYEFVFSGCSQTQGDYITPPQYPEGDHNNIWGFQLANKYNKEALNLGIGGWSAEAILKGLMHHFQKNGNPKVLLVLYPDLGRLSFVDNDKITSTTHSNNYDLIKHFYLQEDDEYHFSKISKIVHSPHDVLPWTQALYQNLQSIIFLEEYCKQNKIYFKYSSWYLTTNVILKLLKNNFIEYQNFCEPQFLDIEDIKLNCHSELINKTSEKVWNFGTDEQHLGVHKHIHIAEMFSEVLNNDNPWD